MWKPRPKRKKRRRRLPWLGKPARPARKKNQTIIDSLGVYKPVVALLHGYVETGACEGLPICLRADLMVNPGAAAHHRNHRSAATAAPCD